MRVFYKLSSKDSSYLEIQIFEDATKLKLSLMHLVLQLLLDICFQTLRLGGRHLLCVLWFMLPDRSRAGVQAIDCVMKSHILDFTKFHVEFHVRTGIRVGWSKFTDRTALMKVQQSGKLFGDVGVLKCRLSDVVTSLSF